MKKGIFARKAASYHLWEYILCLAISVALFAYGESCEGLVKDLLIGIGCSGIAASLMPLLIEKVDETKKRERRDAIRSLCLEEVYYETRTLIERIIWFDIFFDKIDFSKPDDYFFSWEALLEFAQKHEEYYCVIAPEDVEPKLKSLEEKYKIENLKKLSDDRRSCVDSMFRIIGKASENYLKVQEKIKQNRIQYIADGVFDKDEIAKILNCMYMVIEWFKTPESNYGGAISFVLSGYKEILPYMDERVPLYITWKGNYQLHELYFKNRQDPNTDKMGHIIEH